MIDLDFERYCKCKTRVYFPLCFSLIVTWPMDEVWQIARQSLSIVARAFGRTASKGRFLCSILVWGRDLGCLDV